MAKPTYEELERSNENLANHVANFGRMFEENKRALMSHGWETCATKVEKDLAPIAPAYAAGLKTENPFNKIEETF